MSQRLQQDETATYLARAVTAAKPVRLSPYIFYLFPTWSPHHSPDSSSNKQFYNNNIGSTHHLTQDSHQNHYFSGIIMANFTPVPLGHFIGKRPKLGSTLPPADHDYQLGQAPNNRRSSSKTNADEIELGLWRPNPRHAGPDQNQRSRCEARWREKIPKSIREPKTLWKGLRQQGKPTHAGREDQRRKMCQPPAVQPPLHAEWTEDEVLKADVQPDGTLLMPIRLFRAHVNVPRARGKKTTGQGAGKHGGDMATEGTKKSKNGKLGKTEKGARKRAKQESVSVDRKLWMVKGKMH